MLADDTAVACRHGFVEIVLSGCFCVRNHIRLLCRWVLLRNKSWTSLKAAFTKENEGAPTDRQLVLHSTAAAATACTAKQEEFVEHDSNFALEFQNRCLHLAIQLPIYDCDYR